MAAIDKIYLTSYDEYSKFKDWCLKQPPLADKYGKKVSLSTYLFEYSKENFGDCRPVFQAPYYIDAYIIRNCPFDFIQEELMTNYGHFSQSEIEEAYEVVNNRTKENEMWYTYLKPDDFIIVDGVITCPKLENSDYYKIKLGELFSHPASFTDYIPGEHFKCIKHPAFKFNKPFKAKAYDVQIELPKYLENKYMWYHHSTKTWDFSEDFVLADWSSSMAYVPSIKSLKRYVKKWKLPIGTKLKLTGRYTFDNYEFIVKK